jgi:hypothetical protein
MNQQGTGDGVTNLFTISSSTAHWDLSWSYSCPGTNATATTSDIGLGEFLFVVYRYNSEDTSDHGAGGDGYNAQGTQQYSDTGSFTIHVGAQTTCVWDLIAVIPNS